MGWRVEKVDGESFYANHCLKSAQSKFKTIRSTDQWHKRRSGRWEELKRNHNKTDVFRKGTRFDSIYFDSIQDSIRLWSQGNVCHSNQNHPKNCLMIRQISFPSRVEFETEHIKMHQIVVTRHSSCCAVVTYVFHWLWQNFCCELFPFFPSQKHVKWKVDQKNVNYIDDSMLCLWWSKLR